MLVLVGKTCTGKDTIQRILVNEYDMSKVVTYTTRPPRNNEVNGVDYWFVSIYEFLRMDLLEWVKKKVASGETWWYGSAITSYNDSNNKVIILNPDGLKKLRAAKIPAFVVEISSPDDAIKTRQMNRNDEPIEAERRFESDRLDFVGIDKYTDTCVINCGECGPERCARNIYNLYQYWRSKNVENISENTKDM